MFYAVRKGYNPGIYYKWEDAVKDIKYFKSPTFLLKSPHYEKPLLSLPLSYKKNRKYSVNRERKSLYIH